MPLVSILPLEEFSRKIFLTRDAIEQFGFKSGDTVKVRTGSSVTEVIITPSPKGNFISRGALETLGLPKTKELWLKKESFNTLQIGPLIGILVSRGKNYRLPPHTSQGKLLLNFLSYSTHVKYLTYVFTPEGVDMANKTISGYYLDNGPDGKIHWEKHTFPLPDIVYNRILYRTVEQTRLTKQVTSFLLNTEYIKYFNPKFLNKWETHLVLHQNPLLNEHLPITSKYDGPDNLLKFLEVYNTVYLKPVNGSLGKNIIKISLLPEGYRYQYRQRKQTVTGIWQNPGELGTAVENYTSKKAYVMQQGLDLLKFQGRVFDIRVLMQKNGQGQWINSAMVVRLSPEGGIFPNVAAGGKPKNIEVFWQELTSTDWYTSQAFRLTKQVSLIAAETLENYFGTFAEIGLDIGIDVNNNVWIIEINSKPSRKVFPKDQLHLKHTSIRLPIDFAAYLAGFTLEQERNLP